MQPTPSRMREFARNFIKEGEKKLREVNSTLVSLNDRRIQWMLFSIARMLAIDAAKRMELLNFCKVIIKILRDVCVYVWLNAIRRERKGNLALWSHVGNYISSTLCFYRSHTGNFCIALFCSDRVKICTLRVKVARIFFFQIIFESFEI